MNKHDDTVTAPTEQDLAALDARLAASEHPKWQNFYLDRARPCPFFGLAPDENLSEWLAAGRLPGRRAVDLGCGNARNALCLAGRGFDEVLGIDFSASAVAWAREEIARSGLPVRIEQRSVFDQSLPAGAADLVYDSGCFHHIAPHRRADYVRLVREALRPGGAFGLVCFAPEGGSGLSDAAVYEQDSLGGGLGYEAERLREIWSPGFEIAELRRMRDQEAGSGLFGRDFLWVMLAYKKV
ncbi:class I SAM-dependent methyltransferase [Roseateles sp. DAIF2]|uniref:class I SAM-dependent methyltransferase n=1 Tax=Roseateles sp. DAIF2 TaxID=2714952 RepID=UPI0018A2E29E|nr:class I SAM-dependent methyltransferase [Roseateles sp. DAIF2]QPF73965.1 class I SAM-dependent methyltransferase [Roseateles sp. DAIF2]